MGDSYRLESPCPPACPPRPPPCFRTCAAAGEPTTGSALGSRISVGRWAWSSMLCGHSGICSRVAGLNCLALAGLLRAGACYY